MLVKTIKERIILFKESNYRNVSISGLFSTYSHGILYVASSWFAYESMGSISGVALMMFIIWFPSIILGPLAGALADKYDHKRLVLISCLGRGLTITLFSLYQILFNEINIFIMVGVFGLFNAMYMPSVIPLITTVLPKNEFVKANSTIDLVYELGTILGMSSSGFLIHFFNMNITLMFSGSMFILSSLFIYKVRKKIRSTSHNKAQGGVRKKYKETLIYLRENNQLYFLYFIQSFINTLLMTIPVLLVPYVKEYLNGGTSTFSIFESVYSFGVLIGCLPIDKIEKRLGATKSLMLLLSIMGLSLLAMSQTRTIGLSLILYLVCGISLSVWALVLSQVQLKTELQHQGKLQALSNSFSGTFVLIVYLVITLKKDLISIENYYIVIALSCLSLVILTQLFLKPFQKEKRD